jgi:tetratricopeptide (TPR) repeat protein
MRIQSIVLLFSLVLAGCASNKGTAGNDSKELMKRQWASARANILGSLAKEQYEGGSFDKCRATLDDALKMDPENAALRVLSAKLAIEQGNLEMADKELVTARRLDPRNAEADYLGGVVCQRWQRSQDALEYYRSASEKQPSELAYLMARAETLVALGRSEEALSLLEEKVVFFEYSATIRDAVGELLMQKGKYSQAIEVLGQASILAPEDNDIREHLGMAQFQNKQYRDACDILTRVIHDDRFAKRVDLYLALGECGLKLNKPREARDNFEVATDLAPNQASCWTGLGKAALQINDVHRAELSIKRSLALEPASSEANLFFGYVRLKQGMNDEALKAFRKASALDSADTVSLCMIGYVLEKMGKNDEAMRFYARALKLNPGDELATRLSAQVQLDQ